MKRVSENLIAWLCLAITPAALHAATISVVIDAKAPSRPAHFHWTFTSANGSAAQVGQFACGSYWVAPAEGDRGVTFVSLTGNPENTGDARDLLSCDADPLTEKMGLLSSEKTYGNYDAAENLLPRLPVTLTPEAGSCISLVAAMQRNEAATSRGGTKAIVGNVADAYGVVTVLPAPPENGGRDSIRPNITGTTKELLTWDDFDLTRLPTVDFIGPRSAESWATVARRWSHSTEIFGLSSKVGSPARGSQTPTFQGFSEGGRAFRAMLLVPDYASGMGRAFNSDVLSLFSSENKLEDMKPALAAMLAYGLDIYHARYEYGDGPRKRWNSGAGQWSGAFLPTVFAASLLKNETKANQLRMVAILCHGEDRDQLGPQELQQIKRGLTGVLLWGDGHEPYHVPKRPNWGGNQRRYWTDLCWSKCYDGYVGNKERTPHVGKKTAADPYGYIDGPANRPGSSYMGVAFGGVRSLAAVMVLMPAVRRVVNTDAPIEYVDRVTRHGLWTWPDPVAAPAVVDQDSANVWRNADRLKEWRKTWGPDPEDGRFAMEDGKGRFKSLHGRKITGGYEVRLAVELWDRIMALYDGRTFEDNLVELGTVVAPEIYGAPGPEPQVYLICATPDAAIHYTLDGSVPTTDSPLYEGAPIPVRPGTQVRAMAAGEGKTSSAVRERTFGDPRRPETP